MNTRTKNGFTLLELLLVLVITSLLLGLLLPTFAAARKQARMSACTYNLKQVGMAYQLYAADYGYYPNPITVTRYVKDRRVLYCPDDPQLKPNGSSYTFRSVLPPAFKPYWEQAELDSNTVLASCKHHLDQDVEGSGALRRTGIAHYPFRLVLRAGGAVQRVNEAQVRELLIPGDVPAFIRVYPGEPYYNEAKRN